MNAPDRLSFDPEWYLQSNPDVAAAGIDPWLHYQTKGWAEGRLGVPVLALELDKRLWRGQETTALAALNELTERGDAVERGCAGWVLGRWYASQGDWLAARQAIALFHQVPDARHAVPQPGPFVLAAHAAMVCSSADEVRHWAEEMLTACGAGSEFDLIELGRARMLPKPDADEALRKGLGRLYARYDLSPVTLRDGPGCRFDRLCGAATAGMAQLPGEGSQPLVSVIMPVYNAAATLSHAIDSVLAQDWRSLELLLVDDGSADGSAEIMQDRATHDPRIKVIELGSNQGVYCARNAALAAASGQFVTVHDADDWSHPSKLRAQIVALLNSPDLVASVSHWVRASDDLEMARWRIEREGWVHRNVSSLMFRVEMRDKVGFWDRVRFNADTEFYYRLIARFGASSIAEIRPGVPLSWGRSHFGSLTERPESLGRTHLSGIRHDYLTTARYWHAQASDQKALFLPERPDRRPFRVPPGLGPADPPGPATEFDELTSCPWFDPAWYLSAYRDVERAGTGAAMHYLQSGMAEDRDPGPEFSASGYRMLRSVPPEQAAVMHWINTDDAGQLAQDQERASEMSPIVPEFTARLFQKRGPRVLVCAHAAGRQVFGAERSFLDMLQGFRAQGKIPVVVLPEIKNRDYFREIEDLSAAITVMPQAWRRGREAPDARTVEILRQLIRRHEAQEVHVNTLTQNAPLIAARGEQCVSVLHVRELPDQDPPLCQRLEIVPDVLRETLLTEADRFVANSPLVAEWLNCPDRVTVVQNRVDRSIFKLKWSPGPVLRAGMISSNIAKKGVADAVDVARLLHAMKVPVEIVLIGPKTAELRALEPDMGANVFAPGYTEDVCSALEQLDVILSLSHFAESFGRTVLEGLAAGRPVICYDRGMPARLVRGEGWFSSMLRCGTVVPADMPQAVAEELARWAADPRRLRRMSRAARARAWILNRG